MPARKWYKHREQTYIKHFILESYLEKLAFKVGWWCDTINYVDCFAGPWKQEDDNLNDTSPFIAISKLRQVRTTLVKHGKNPKIRCLFVEKRRESWELLKRRISGVHDIECEALLGEFEDQIDSIVSFCGQPSSRNFSFFFIDPTGWTGFALDMIRPLLEIKPSEVLVNFMTQHVSRFIDAGPAVDKDGFRRLFGSLEVQDRWADLAGSDREFEIVRTYGELIGDCGGFQHIAPTIILHPTDDRTHFHLIYATRHDEGLRTFRNEAERPAFDVQRQARWKAQGAKELERSGQMELYEQPQTSTYLDDLKTQYRSMMIAEAEEILKSQGKVLYKHLELRALAWPLMNSNEIKDWIQKERSYGRLEIEGLGTRERAPKHDREHYIVWKPKLW